VSVRQQRVENGSVWFDEDRLGWHSSKVLPKVGPTKPWLQLSKKSIFWRCPDTHESTTGHL
jgi:hypothetical protein